MGGSNWPYASARGVPPKFATLRWRMTDWNGSISVVLLDMAPPLMRGETIIWEGAAAHLAETYRLARKSGLPIYRTRAGFRLRRPKDRQSQKPD